MHQLGAPGASARCPWSTCGPSCWMLHFKLRIYVPRVLSTSSTRLILQITVQTGHFRSKREHCNAEMTSYPTSQAPGRERQLSSSEGS